MTEFEKYMLALQQANPETGYQLSINDLPYAEMLSNSPVSTGNLSNEAMLQYLENAGYDEGLINQTIQNAGLDSYGNPYPLELLYGAELNLDNSINDMNFDLAKNDVAPSDWTFGNDYGGASLKDIINSVESGNVPGYEFKYDSLPPAAKSAVGFSDYLTNNTLRNFYKSNGRKYKGRT